MPADTTVPSHAATPSRAGRRDRLDRSHLYVCTDARGDSDDLVAFAQQLLEGGVDLLQVRDKQLEARAEIDALLQVQGETKARDALLAVNDRADVAVLVGADVLHIGQGDLSSEQARRIVGEDMLIGRSTHSESQLLEANSDPSIDYFCVGPVWETPTKPGRKAVGLDLIRFAADRATKPWFAIGGIDRDSRVHDVVAAGATRIVVVRAVRDTPRESAARLRRIVTGV